MADAGDNISRRKEREPISMVCLVVLLIAGAAVLCTYVNDHYLTDDRATVEYGNSVTLEYTGSLYTHYDEGGDVKPVIFDTNISGVGTSDKYYFTNSFNPSKTYEQSTIVLGKHTFLPVLEDAIIGHKVGDTFRVKVEAKDAYVQANQNKICDKGTEETYLQLTKTFEMSKSEYKTFFGTDPADNIAFDYDKITDTDGNPVKVHATIKENMVTVVFGFTDGDYIVKNVENYGKLIMHVSGEKYYLSVENSIKVGNSKVKDASGNEMQEIEMITFDTLPGLVTNVIGLDGDKVMYNHGADRASISNMDLYFVVKIVSKK